MLKQPPEGFFKKDVMKNFAEFTRKHPCRNLFFWYFLMNFAKFVRTEHQRTTPFDYSSINSSEGSIGKRNSKL